MTTHRDLGSMGKVSLAMLSAIFGSFLGARYSGGKNIPLIVIDEVSAFAGRHVSIL